MSKTEITNSDDLIDIRDVIERVEELRSERGELQDAIDKASEPGAPASSHLATAKSAMAEWDDENGQEVIALTDLLDECRGNGGDHKWEGDWYPVTLIRDSYFKTYAQDLAEEIGAIDPEAKWPNNCIDWDKAVRELQMDYSTADFDGVTYWFHQ